MEGEHSVWKLERMSPETFFDIFYLQKSCEKSEWITCVVIYSTVHEEHRHGVAAVFTLQMLPQN